MSTKDFLIVIALLLLCIFGFKPAINNFMVVWRDKKNPRVSSGMRKFILLWLGLGVASMPLLFLFLIYVSAVKLGYLPNTPF